MRGRVLGARRQERGDEELKWILGLLGRDPLHRRHLEPVNGVAEGAHHLVDDARGRRHGTGVSGGCPPRTARTLRTARSAIAVRVSVVPLAMCGASSTFSSGSKS